MSKCDFIYNKNKVSKKYKPLSSKKIIKSLKKRNLLTNIDQMRRLWGEESSKRNPNFSNLSKYISNNDKLKIMTFNMYYGRIIDITNKDTIDNGIKVNEYEDIFKHNIDVICLQEVVLGKLPKNREKEGNSTKDYIERARKSSDNKARSGASVEYWKKWTNIFKENDFRQSWEILKNIASKYGYKPYPKEGCDIRPSSMYKQKMGNVIFYNKKLINEEHKVRKAFN